MKLTQRLPIPKAQIKQAADPLNVMLYRIKTDPRRLKLTALAERPPKNPLEHIMRFFSSPQRRGAVPVETNYSHSNPVGSVHDLAEKAVDTLTNRDNAKLSGSRMKRFIEAGLVRV